MVGGLPTINEEEIETPIVQQHIDKLDFNHELEVFKFKNSVFVIGTLDNNYLKTNFCDNFLYNILNLLDRGSKFIPCYFANNFYFYSNIIEIYKNFILNINNKIFFANLADNEIGDFYSYNNRNINKLRDYFIKLNEDNKNN